MLIEMIEANQEADKPSTLVASWNSCINAPELGTNPQSLITEILYASQRVAPLIIKHYKLYFGCRWRCLAWV